VGVGGNEMHKALANQPLREAPHLGAKRPDETRGRQLKEAAGINQGSEHLWPGENSLVAFRVGKDPHHSGGVEVAEQPVERKTEFVRQLQEQITTTIGQCEHLARPDLWDHIGLDSDVGPRFDTEPDPSLVEKLLQLNAGVANRSPMVVSGAAQLVRGC